MHSHFRHAVLDSRCTVLVGAIWLGAGFAQTAWDLDSLNVRFEPERCGCAVVEFPDAWAFGRGTIVVEAGEFLFREAADGTLLVGKTGSPGESTNHFAILGWPTPRAASIPLEKWKAAKPFNRKYNSIVKPSNLDMKSVGSISFRGHEYRKMGQHWAQAFAAALPSLDQELLALQSYSGAEWGVRNPVRGGEIFVDIHDAGSSKSICRVSGTHQVHNGTSFLTETYWLPGRRLAIAVAPMEMRRMVYCDFRSSTR